MLLFSRTPFNECYQIKIKGLFKGDVKLLKTKIICIPNFHPKTDQKHVWIMFLFSVAEGVSDRIEFATKFTLTKFYSAEQFQVKYFKL